MLTTLLGALEIKKQSIINWSDEVTLNDIVDYENQIEEMLSLDDLDERMSMCDSLLMSIEDSYPNIYDEVEDEIKDLVV